jgi:hypothetical protein
MEEAKKKRKTAKSWLTRAANDLKEKLDTAGEQAILQLLEDLNQRFSKYEAAQDAVDELVAEEEIDEEVDASNAYRKSIMVTKIDAQEKLSSLRDAAATAAAAAATDDATSQGGCSGSSCSSGSRHTLARLPKVALPTFAGNVLEWTTFWEQFSAHVHSAEEMDAITKFGYLKPQLQGEAANCISGLVLTAANYPIAVDLLKRRFGRPERLIFAHLEGLLKTPVLPDSRTAKDLWRLSDALQTHVRCLENLGVAGEQYGVVLTPLLLSRLPDDLRMEWARDGIDRESDLVFLMEFLRMQVERKERAEAFVSTPSSEDKEKPLPSRPKTQSCPPTASALAAPSSDSHECAVCRPDKHPTKECERFAQVKNGTKFVPLACASLALTTDTSAKPATNAALAAVAATTACFARPLPSHR